MVNCGKCGKTTKSGEKPVRVVLETRQKMYTNSARGEKDMDIAISRGSEIAKEAFWCSKCASERMAE